MTIKRVKEAAAARDMYFDGVKGVNCWYFIYGRDGRLLAADTLQGLYNLVMKYTKVKKY